MLVRLASLASLAAALHLAVASPLPLTRRTDPSEPSPVVDLGYAQYQGVLNETYNMYEWRGIRYGTAERFQAPRTPSKNSGDSSPILADQFGNVCYISQVGANTTQGVLTEEATTPSAMQSEDCLFLNVVSPAGSCEGAHLPVVVYIHGGGASSVPCTRIGASRERELTQLWPCAQGSASATRRSSSRSSSSTSATRSSSSRSSTASAPSVSSPGARWSPMGH